MGVAEFIALAALVASIALPVLSARYSDARAKGRAEAIEKATDDRAQVIIKTQEEQDKRLRAMEIATALDHQTVDGFCDRLDAMREDMDKRFDKIESLITRGK